MNKEHLYQEWLNQKKNVRVDESFTDAVMAKIHADRQRPETSLFTNKWFSLRFVKAALITVGFVGGLIRIGGIIGLILGSCIEAQGGVL